MATVKNLQSYKSGYIDVSDDHSLYFELYGNPKGIPVLFLHGGPGAGFSDKDKVFFNKNRYHVIFFDQRGSSRSKPFGSIKNNTTQHLVSDINKILDYLNFDKVYVFGGSWSSSIALVYAIHHPERVLGLIVRGNWLANKYGLGHYITGSIKEFFPDGCEGYGKVRTTGEKPEDNYIKKIRAKSKNSK